MSETAPCRPMIFSTGEAFRQLRDNSRVLTARSEKKPDGPVWIRQSRTGPKEFDGYRELVKVLTSERAFTGYAKENHNLAGFDNCWSWVRKYKDHQGDVSLPVYVYQVARDEGGDEDAD